MIQDHLIKLHKRIYRYMKKKALSYEGAPGKELAKYQRSYAKQSQRPFVLSSTEEILQAARNSHMTFIGDLHTFNQNSKNARRLITELIKHKGKIAIGMEMIQNDHQIQLNAYLNRHLTAIEFLDSINYHHSWRFPWNHYQEILALAQDEKIPVIGLNTKGTLKERDEAAAEIIQEFITSNPETHLIVFFGELHIVADKLPSYTLKKLTKKQKKSYTIIHQNLDDVYWALAETHLENPSDEHIVRFNENEFSIQSSPPWTKYESMVYWYEGLCEDPEFDLHEHIVETGLKTLGSSSQDYFLLICQEILQFMKIDHISQEKVQDFNLYDHSQMDIIHSKIQKIPSSSIRKSYEQLLTLNHSFGIVGGTDYYCSSYSINRIACLAGLHVFILMTQDHAQMQKILLSKKQLDKFTLLFSATMSAYFASKIINPNRKCDLYLDLLRKVKTSDSDKQSIIKLALNIIDASPDKLKSFLARLRPQTLFAVNLYVGPFFGELLFQEISKTDQDTNIMIEKAKSFLYQKGFSLDHFYELKKFLSQNQDYKQSRKKLF